MTLTIHPPLLNTASAWASTYEDLKALYECPHTGAVTTRTATIDRFPHDPQIHKVAFSRDTQSSINSYGYSPYPLAQYLEWIDRILTERIDSNKVFIISIAASLGMDTRLSKQAPLDPTRPKGESELTEMLQAIQDLRKKHNDDSSVSPRIAVEINTSCPNLPGHSPPAYEPASLRPILERISTAFFEDMSLAVGLKLPPYLHERSFVEVVDFLASFTRVAVRKGVESRKSPVAFLTCTNTLGSALLFEEQVEDGTNGFEGRGFALPSALGGLAGDAIHPLALGNVHSFSKLLRHHQDTAMQEIAIIGVGGVTSSAAAKRMIAAGASAVGCATILGKKGVGVFEEIARAFDVA